MPERHVRPVSWSSFAGIERRRSFAPMSFEVLKNGSGRLPNSQIPS
jgi:hypothetical protein